MSNNLSKLSFNYIYEAYLHNSRNYLDPVHEIKKIKKTRKNHIK